MFGTIERTSFSQDLSLPALFQKAIAWTRRHLIILSQLQHQLPKQCYLLEKQKDFETLPA
jgi:hypothetical protein